MSLVQRQNPKARLQRHKKANCGTILIISLWVLSILTIFAVGLGHRLFFEIKLVESHLDSQKAYYIAKAGIERAIAERRKALLGNGGRIYADAFNQPWFNNPDIFKDSKIGEGRYSVLYKLHKPQTGQILSLYGMSDEQARININTASFSVIKALLRENGMDESAIESTAAAIIDWRDEDKAPFEGVGAEESFYRMQDPPYLCKDSYFDSPEELLLVRGITPEIFHGKDINADGIIGPEEEGLKKDVTVFGSSRVNINTAGKTALKAVIGEEEVMKLLPDKIIEYRQGPDREFGTADDRWFVREEPGGRAGTQYLNLTQEWVPLPQAAGFTNEEWAKLADLAQEGTEQDESPAEAVRFCTTSDFFMIRSCADVRGLKRYVTAVAEFKEAGKCTISAWRLE